MEGDGFAHLAFGVVDGVAEGDAAGEVGSPGVAVHRLGSCTDRHLASLFGFGLITRPTPRTRITVPRPSTDPQDQFVLDLVVTSGIVVIERAGPRHVVRFGIGPELARANRQGHCRLSAAGYVDLTRTK